MYKIETSWYETVIELDVINVFNEEGTYTIEEETIGKAYESLLRYAVNCYLGWQTFEDEGDRLRNLYNWKVAKEAILGIMKSPV